MSTPLILLGYTKPTVNVPDYGVDSNGAQIETRQSILISLLISIEPIIEITHFSTSHLECVELRAIKNRIAVWLSEVRDEFPSRAHDPLVSLANGKRVCITRLIGPIDIPFERNETSEYMIRRFVSLIPIRPHKNVCTKLNGVWLTNEVSILSENFSLNQRTQHFLTIIFNFFFFSLANIEHSDCISKGFGRFADMFLFVARFQCVFSDGFCRSIWRHNVRVDQRKFRILFN